jgi:hypothetical protein
MSLLKIFMFVIQKKLKMEILFYIQLLVMIIEEDMKYKEDLENSTN